MTLALASQILISFTTLLAAFLGFVFAGWNDARRDRRTAERERVTRAEDRHTAAVRDRHQFQLETLLALQDAIQLMARLTGRTMHFDHMQAREGKYNQLPGDDDNEILSNGFDVIRLRNRLLDDELREAIDEFHAAASHGLLPPTHYQGLSGEQLETAAALLSSRFGNDYTRVMDKLGIALRTELAWTPDTYKRTVRTYARMRVARTRVGQDPAKLAPPVPWGNLGATVRSPYSL